MSASPLMLLGAIMVLGAGGLLALRALARHLRPLQPGDTAPEGFLLWLAGFAVTIAAGAWLAPSGAGAPLTPLLLAQAFGSLLGVGALLLLAALRRTPASALGLRAQRGVSPVLTGVVAWCAFLPVYALVTWLNAALLHALQVEQPMQRWLVLFQQAPDGTALAWMLMVLLLPACEELLFRGALYGGLRRLLQPAAAVASAALVFGLVHEPLALLPAAALGAALALLYERTGSLAAPLVFHALHNGLTLAMV